MSTNDIWVVCDKRDNCDYSHIRQVISKAAELAEVNNDLVSVVCIGQFLDEQLHTFAAYGADKIIMCKQSTDLSEAAFANILEEMIHHYKPKLILYMSSPAGKEVAAYISVRFESGLTADVIDIEIDDEHQYVFSRAAMSSSVIARIASVNSTVHMCTVKQNVFVERKNYLDKKLQIDYFLCKKEPDRDIRHFEVLSVEMAPENYKTISIQDSQLVFALGRGIKDKQSVALLSRVAKKYNAQIVGTRAAVEEQLIEKEYQVGQSGCSIAPRIYIGFGISGATQHIVGIINSQVVIAVNTDIDAPIFRFTDYAIVDDATAILTKLDRLVQ